MTADQWRGDCLSACAHPCLRTPDLDALAGDGVLFRRRYAATARRHRARRGRPVDAFTENVDIMPTILDCLGLQAFCSPWSVSNSDAGMLMPSVGVRRRAA